MKNWKTWLGAWVLLAGLTAARAQEPQPADAPEDHATDAAAAHAAAVATLTNQVEAIESADGHAEVTVSTRHGRIRTGRRGGDAPIVVFGKDFTLRSNETAEVVVVIGGTAKIQGKVSETVVAIAGDVETEGAEIGDAVVAVLGNVKIGPGTVVDGDVVGVGGDVDVDETAKVDGEVQPVQFQMPGLIGIRDFVGECVFMLRPLSLKVGWVWWIFGAFFVFYLLVAVVLPRPVQVCVDEITRRPATTFFMAILTILLLPIVLVVLAATGIGVIVIPFLMAALFFGALIGKVAFLEYLGFSLGKLFGAASLKPAMALTIGSVLLALLYLVPILGLVVFAITSLWGLGAAVTAGFGSLKRETDRPPTNGGTRPQPTPPATPTPAPMSAMSTLESMPVDPSAAPLTEPTAAASVGAGFFAGTTPVPPAPVSTAGEAYTLPRASFWERMGAALLDMVLTGMLCGFVGGPPFGFLVILAYFVGMWTWKGTTIGGIVVNLKVVRLDDQPVTIVVAIVRGLGAAFSAMALFLGFFWIAWDKERQGWHDKIAGTVIVRVPRARPLV